MSGLVADGTRSTAFPEGKDLREKPYALFRTRIDGAPVELIGPSARPSGDRARGSRVSATAPRARSARAAEGAPPSRAREPRRRRPRSRGCGSGARPS
jgi:hypothetical protein